MPSKNESCERPDYIPTDADWEATKKFHISDILVQLLFDLQARVSDGWLEKWTEKFIVELRHYKGMDK